MALTLYDNIMGFRPRGKVLKYWLMLPQVNTSVGEEDVPSLYGNLQSVFIPILMVLLLIVIEGILMSRLNEEGIDFITLFIISFFDFVIAVIPVFIFLSLDLYPALIKANIFVLNQKIKITHPHDENFNNREQYNASLKEDLKTWKSKKTLITILNLFFALVIIGFSFWKFMIYYEIFREDIFVESIGRFILIVILFGIITHLLFTKTVCVYLLFKTGFNAQLADFKKHQTASEYHVNYGEKNKRHEIEYAVKYRPAFSGNQRLAQSVSINYQENPEEKIIELDHDGIKHKYRVSDFADNRSIYLVSTGILTDPEIQGLYTNQDPATQKAIIAACKVIQLAH